MNMRNIGRGPRLLIALGLLFLALVLLPQTAYVQGPDPASPPSEAAPAATTAGCQDKVPGQKIKLLDEAEIVVSFRNQIGFLQAVQLGDTSGSLTKDGNWLHPLAIDVKWPSVTTADLNGDGAYESVCAYRDYNDRLAAFSLPEFHYMWYTDVGQQKGDIKYIDIAAGNLDRSAEGDDEVVIAFADDGHDIQLLALQGNPYGGLGNSPNHCYGQWWYAGSGYGRGDVSHVAVATGDLNGDGYDDEIVTAFKDGNKDLQVIVFKRPPGDSHLQVLYEKTWSTEYRGHIAKHGERGLDVTTGDLDQDLQDEIVIAFSDSGNQVQVLVLDYTGKSRGQYNFDDGTFTRFNAAVHTLYNDCPYFCASYEGWPYYLSAATGDIDRDGKDEIVVGYTSYHGVDQVSAWEGALVDARYPVVRTLEYAAAFPSSLTVKNSWYSRSSSADTYYSVRYMSVGAGDMNGDGKAEIVAAFRDKGKDLQVWAFNGNLTKRSSWEDRGELRETVEDIWVTVGDLDNDSLYGVYTGQCTSVTQAQVMAVAHTPPRWPWLQENPTLNASYGKSRTVATSDSQKVSDSYGGSLTMNAGFSIDVVDLGASTTFAWEESASRTWTEGTSRSVAVAQGSDMVTNDPVVFQEVTYYCYKYRQYVGNTPQAGAYSRVCIPTTSLQPRGPDLAKWNSSVGNEFPSSWVPLGRCSPRPDLVPTEVKDPNTSDGQFQVKINGVWHTVPGKILWTWGDLSGWGIPSEKLGAFQVGTGEGVASWEITTENIFSRDVEKTYKYNETIGGKASVLGIGAEGSVTWGFEKGSSHTVSWSDAFSMGGDVAGLPQGTVGKDYKYVPYLYKQTQESSTGIEQTYFVLDYYVTDPPPADPLNNGLVGWWKGDGQAVNEVGAPCACYGSLYGGMDYDTGFAAGKVGLAFKLDGTNDRVRVAHTDAFNVNRLTVAAWVKCNASPDTPDQGIVGKGDAWSLSRNTYADAAILRIAGAAVPGEVNSLGDDQWHHVVGAYDGSTVRLYVDGNLETSAPPPGTLPTNADDLWIGGRADCPQYGSCFNGLIDEVRLYNRALTAAEVQALYDAENSAASPAPAKGGDDPGLAPLPPVIDSPTHPDPATWYANRTATFTWAQPVGDPATVTGYRWYLDHAATTVPDPIHLGLTTTVTYQDLPDGLWYLHLRARGDGDEWGDTAHRALRIDVDPPQVTLALDPPAPTGNASWYNTPLTVTVVTTDGTGSGVAAVEVRTDGAIWQPYTAPLSFPTDTPTTTLWARATDVAGHVSTPVSATFKVDVTPPSSKVEIGGQTFGVYIAHVVTDTLGNQHLVLAGHITDTLSGRAGMNIVVNGGEQVSADTIGVWHPISSMPEIEVNWYYTATTELGRGKHYFVGGAQDQAGNLEEPYDLIQVTWFPPDYPELDASDMAVTPPVARPGDEVTFVIAVRNGGEQEAQVAVTDTLPAGLTLVTDSLAPDVGYDLSTGVVVWPAKLLWPGQWVKHTFRARVDQGQGAAILENQAIAHAFWPNAAELTPAQYQYFQEHEDAVVVSATVTVDPGLPASADVTPPQVSLVILNGQVVSQREVSLGISADADARWMYLREWTLDPTVGTWTVAGESDWIRYSPTYTWTLSAGEGIKYLGVWVADGWRNVSLLDEGALAFTNLVGSGRVLAAGQRAQYRFDLDLGALALFQLVSSSGDADLYVWNPRHAFRPNYFSNNLGLADAVGFWVEEAGRYLVEVEALGETRYTLTTSHEAEAGNPSAVSEKPRPAHPLTVSDPLSAGSAVPPVDLPPHEIHEIYLPLAFRGGILP